jgi:putative transposase
MYQEKTKTNWMAVDEIIEKFGNETFDIREHFRVGKLECYELAKVRSTRHSRYNINYHFVWIPKTRSKVLHGSIANTIKDTIISVCKEKCWMPLAMEVMPEHIHFFMSAPPKWAPAEIMKTIKGIVSKRVRDKFPILKKYRRDELWADSYYVGTAGHVSQEQVIRYIAEQTKDQHLKPFSYSAFDKSQKTLFHF